MPPSQQPSGRRLQRAGCWVVAIILAIILVIFVARNIWHGEELHEDQVTGEANVTQHTAKSYD
ncbi:hypothetical protein C100_05260 [Sphingobium sp. C100]|uniref:hypothetical protein n=1 Tax=Sphingobium sp. C100 TaxID=1207055 RepID=UPI0003D59AA3|nr:hypothetical protein [Sphingobium sp. C100]ETI64889.1 hypothetical protein C100_05260 [Sphingobium sp. C100]